MALSAPGVGSNLDINSIVSQLMSIEQQPLTKIARQEASFNAKLSAIGTLKSALSAFQTAVKGLSDPNKIQASKVSIGDSAIASVSRQRQGHARHLCAGSFQAGAGTETRLCRPGQHQHCNRHRHHHFRLRHHQRWQLRQHQRQVQRRRFYQQRQRQQDCHHRQQQQYIERHPRRHQQGRHRRDCLDRQRRRHFALSPGAELEFQRRKQQHQNFGDGRRPSANLAEPRSSRQPGLG